MKRVFLLAVILLAAGCGVPIESQPHPVTLPNRASPSAVGQPAATAGTATQLLYLVQDGRLVPVTRAVPTEPDPSDQLHALLAGPTDTEREKGLSSALLGTELGLTVELRQRQARVELATSLDGTGRTDDILALAQIVCTLTTNQAVDTVVFTRSGEQVEVPRADSSLTRGPLTAADYSSLIAPR
jgi:spore germination protein GerM